jgi:hypothetical protein
MREEIAVERHFLVARRTHGALADNCPAANTTLVKRIATRQFQNRFINFYELRCYRLSVICVHFFDKCVCVCVC